MMRQPGPEQLRWAIGGAIILLAIGLGAWLS
jgi:hypothetical protein